jgi:hypothetical protein
MTWNSLRLGGDVEVVEHSVTPIFDDATIFCPYYALWERTSAQAEQAPDNRFSIERESANCGSTVVSSSPSLILVD